MKTALEQKLRTTFPFINRCCECADGWYQLLYNLCQELTDRYEKNNKDIIKIWIHIAKNSEKTLNR